MVMGDSSLGEILMKVGMFLVVQGLVYLILSQSSNIFSKDKKIASLSSFRTARSVSIRRMLAALQDIPASSEPSPPSNRSPSSPTLPGEKSTKDA